MHQDPDRDRYTSDEEGTVVVNAADELELIASRNAQPDYFHMEQSSVPSGTVCAGSNTVEEDMVCQIDG